MFCPSCGSEERHISQFCRACGTNLRAVRTSLEKPDAITASAISARSEIGRAIADKIRDLQKADDLGKVAEDVLPEIEKFLESPQERRLRRLRAGVLMIAIGLGATLFFLLMGLAEKDSLFLIGLGATAFLIGVGLILNALMFTVPNQYVPDRSSDAGRQNLLDQSSDSVSGAGGELPEAERLRTPSSIAEHTTRHLTGEATAPSLLRDRH